MKFRQHLRVYYNCCIIIFKQANNMHKTQTQTTHAAANILSIFLTYTHTLSRLND